MTCGFCPSRWCALSNGHWAANLCMFPDSCCLFLTGWSVKGERWGRGQSKPSSLPAVILSEPLQMTDTCSWSGSRRASISKMKTTPWLQMTTLLTEPAVTVWRRRQRRWTDLSTSELQLFSSWTIYNILLTNNCHVVYWTINVLKSLPQVSASCLVSVI